MTLDFLVKNGVTDHKGLEARVSTAGDDLDALSVRIKQLEGRMAEVAQLTEEYAALQAEKKERYEEYRAARKDMIDYQNAEQNVDRILGLTLQKIDRLLCVTS